MDWSSFLLGILAAFVISTIVSLVIAAVLWPQRLDQDDLP